MNRGARYSRHAGKKGLAGDHRDAWGGVLRVRFCPTAGNTSLRTVSPRVSDPELPSTADRPLSGTHDGGDGAGQPLTGQTNFGGCLPGRVVRPLNRPNAAIGGRSSRATRRLSGAPGTSAQIEHAAWVRQLPISCEDVAVSSQSDRCPPSAAWLCAGRDTSPAKPPEECSRCGPAETSRAMSDRTMSRTTPIRERRRAPAVRFGCIWMVCTRTFQSGCQHHSHKHRS